jgi:eukaryotic-like serine/threonine-protein kinase
MKNEEEIFYAAVELPGGERATFLENACAGQPALLDRVEALLRSHDLIGFMEDCTGAPHAPAVEQAGERIGRYRLQQEIGEGGFGVVWMAEQVEPVTRRVALKIIKAGMDTKEVITRFEAERQALAMMDHPNIARVFDAGATDKGRPFFVMELVKGIPVTQFCDGHEFTTRQRLELFSDVCSAIHHAHQKGVIHRDIKPSNVMVTLHGDKPVPKVIDFGIAKATRGRLTERTLFTRFEQFIGTPAYMSPEQATLSGLDVDTRSDIYALGILLYELLTGTPPFDEKSLISAGYDEMRRIIREVNPPKPSTSLGRASGMRRATLAKSRHVSPEGLRRLVEPDLDLIVMKSIAKDRERRYETANDLALDIRRFLDHEPVSAMSPGAGYRFRKFAHRNRVALRVTAAIFMVLVAATVVSTSMAVRAWNAEKQSNQKASDEIVARKLADEALINAENTSRFFAGAIHSPANGGSNMTVVEAINLAIEELEKKFSAPTQQDIDRQDNILWTLHTLGFTRRIIPIQEKIRNFCANTYGPHHGKYLISSLNLAFYIRVAGPDSDREKAIRILEELVAAEPGWPADKGKEWLETLANLAECYEKSNRRMRALKLREKALLHCRKSYADDSRMTLSAMTHLATALCDKGRMQEAIALREEVLATYRKTNGDLHERTLSSTHHLANLYYLDGQNDRALKLREGVLPLFRKELGEKNPDTLIAIHNYAESCFDAGRKDQALQLLEEVWALRPEVSGLKNKDTLEAMHDLATCYCETGKLEEALKLREKVLPLRSELLGADNPDTLEAMTNLAISLRSARKLPEALGLQEEAITIMNRVLKEQHPFLKAALEHRALILEMTGGKDEVEILRRLIAGLGNKEASSIGAVPANLVR